MRTKALLFSVIICSFSLSINAQKTYEDKKGNKHLSGEFDLSALEKDTTYNKWYNTNYEEFEVNGNKAEWVNNLKDKEVEIYLGTWCGDSKTWVPSFVKLWDELGLDKKQLKFIALHNGKELYKRNPKGDEEGKMIHRVPTFIFKEKGKEIGRIVESPQNDLMTDVAQIALGYPSVGNYKAANYLMKIMENDGLEELRTNFKTHVNKAYRLQSGSRELNTLGYVYLNANKDEEALMIFYMNVLCNKYNPNVYDSYGEVLAKTGKTEQAIEQYKKVLSLKTEDKNASEQIELLEAKLRMESIE